MYTLERSRWEDGRTALCPTLCISRMPGGRRPANRFRIPRVGAYRTRLNLLRRPHFFEHRFVKVAQSVDLVGRTEANPV